MRPRSIRRMMLPLVLLALQTPGCIGLQSNDARSFERFPPVTIAPGPRVQLGVEVDSHASGVATGIASRDKLAERVRDRFSYFLSQTGRISVGEQNGAARRPAPPSPSRS